MSLDEILAFRRNPHGDRLIMIKLENCPPCELLERAVPKVAELDGYELSDVLVRFEDKRSMGVVLKAGISDFPLFEVYRNGAKVLSCNSVRGGTVDEVAAHLSVLVRTSPALS